MSSPFVAQAGREYWAMLFLPGNLFPDRESSAAAQFATARRTRAPSAAKSAGRTRRCGVRHALLAADRQVQQHTGARTAFAGNMRN